MNRRQFNLGLSSMLLNPTQIFAAQKQERDYKGLVEEVERFIMEKTYLGQEIAKIDEESNGVKIEVDKNKGFAIGNGIVFMLFLLIPIIGIILVLPLSVTAASTRTLKILHGNPQIVYEK